MTIKDIAVKLGQNVLIDIDASNQPTTIKDLGNFICKHGLNIALDVIPENIQTQNIKRQIRKELNLKKMVVYFKGENAKYNPFNNN